VRFVGSDSDFVASEVEIGHGEVGKFRDTHAGLEKKFDDGGDAGIGAAGVAKSAVLEFTEDAGRFEVVFRMADGSSGVNFDQILALKVAEEGLNGVKFTADGLGGVVFTVEIGLEVVDIL